MFQDWEGKGIPSQFVSESSIDWDFCRRLQTR